MDGPGDAVGLRRHTVRVVAHRPEWAVRFEAEAASLREAVGDLVVDIQHVGSTAVAGLVAKPILDIAVAVAAKDAIPRVIARLVARGYIDRGDGGSDGGHLCVWEPEPDVRTVHVHVVEEADPQWRDYLFFRDTLRADEGVRRRYDEAKRRLAATHPHDRRAYGAGKEELIESVLRGRS